MSETTTEEPRTAVGELLRIQTTLSVPKNQRNTHSNFNYRSCEDILEALKPMLGDGNTIKITDDLVQIGERYYVKAVATFRRGEATISAVGYARESEDKKGMDAAQITGAASSYARKYALNALLLIDDSRDSDTPTDKTPAKSEDPKVAPATEDQKNAIADYYEQLGVSEDDQIAGAKWASDNRCTSAEDLDANQAAKLKQMLQRKLEKRK